MKDEKEYCKYDAAYWYKKFMAINYKKITDEVKKGFATRFLQEKPDIANPKYIDRLLNGEGMESFFKKVIVILELEKYLDLPLGTFLLCGLEASQSDLSESISEILDALESFKSEVCSFRQKCTNIRQT